MAPQLTGKSSKYFIERTSWREDGMNGSSLILTIVKEAATHAPFVQLKQAACVTLIILQTIQVVKENKEAYERLGDDSGGLIAAIWRSYKKAEVPEEWLSVEMREILEDLTHTLENICSFVQARIAKKKAIRTIFSKSSDDDAKVSEYREHLNYAIQKFELQSHININEVLTQLVKKNDQLSEHILHRNEEDNVKRALEITAREARDRQEAEKIQAEELKAVQEIAVLERLKQVEIDRQARDEKWRSNELKKIEKETEDRQLELERLRTAASALEIANRLKKAQEEEMDKLRRIIAAGEGGRRGNMIQGQSSNNNHTSRQQDEAGEEEGWGENVAIEEATSEEDEGVRKPARRSSKVKRNPLKSPRRRPVKSDDSTDDDEDLQSLSSSRIRTAGRKLSSTSLRVEEMEDESTDEEEDCTLSPPRKSPRVDRKPRGSSGSPSRDADDPLAQINGPMTLGGPHRNGSNSRRGSPTYLSTCHPFSSSIRPYGYGLGVPGLVVNSGVGNITNTTISNIGNNRSKIIYR